MENNIYSPKVSVVILNWNGGKYIHVCINSVLSQTYKTIEVILVDNCSSDGSIQDCMENYKTIIFVVNQENYGFAKGMNIGISRASGEYILLLNTDVCLRNDYIEKCIQVFKHDLSVGCVAGYEYLWTNGNFTTIKSFTGYYGLKKRLQISATTSLVDREYTFGVSGSFPMFSSSSIQDIMDSYAFFFDEKFETGWEDNDLRFRFIFRNWKTKIANTIAWHVGSASDAENKKLIDKSYNYQVRIFRNRFFIQKKYISTLYPLWNIQLNILNLFIPIYYLFVNPVSAKAYIQGYVLFKRNMKYLKQQQKITKESICVDKKELYKYLIGF